ncbi:MAG TPA: hypothetical protein VEF34_11375, partial [Syntrophobacteraceae bacterium]|nr:hypothetical protein [Syntrophobacteraceae bacterium]
RGPAEDKGQGYERFGQALQRCVEKKWKEALDIFESLPDDPVSKVYADRCRSIVENPGADWNGIWDLDRK